MAQGKNHVTLLGNVGKDVEFRTTPGGTAVATVSLATTEAFKDKQGHRTNKTEWHNLVAFGRMAEVLRDHVRKGSRIDVVGRLQTRTWDDKESGGKRTVQRSLSANSSSWMPSAKRTATTRTRSTVTSESPTKIFRSKCR